MRFSEVSSPFYRSRQLNGRPSKIGKDIPALAGLYETKFEECSFYVTQPESISTILKCMESLALCIIESRHFNHLVSFTCRMLVANMHREWLSFEMRQS